MINFNMDSLSNKIRELLDFEDKVAHYFNSGKIKAPVHLSNGGEKELINIFSNIRHEDYVFTTWRSHYHALLKGIDQGLLLREILAGNSISLNFPESNFYSSAIAAIHLPLAVGAAYGIKIRNSSQKVWCFIGDMTAESGIANTSIKYAFKYDLPVTFVIEDNNLSVCSDTRLVWNTQELSYSNTEFTNVITYQYVSKYPHSGAGERVQF